MNVSSCALCALLAELDVVVDSVVKELPSTL